MPVFIDNTNVLRVTSATLTGVDGSVVSLTDAGSFTVYDKDGAEVAGQVWPTALTLNSAGNYAGIIESDVEFIQNQKYKAIVIIGDEPNGRYLGQLVFYPQNNSSY